MFLKLADKVDIDAISDKFETGQIESLILDLCPLDCCKKPLFDFVILVTLSVLIGCSENLQIRWWTWKKLGQVQKLARSDHYFRSYFVIAWLIQF